MEGHQQERDQPLFQRRKEEWGGIAGPPGKMRFVTFQRVIKNDAGADAVNPVLEYGTPVSSQDGSVIRPVQLQVMEEVGLMSADGTRILPLARTAFSFPDMNTLIAESTPEMLQEGGLSQDEYAAFLAKRHDFGAASKRANDRLKAMKEGYTFYDDLFDGFDATSPTQEPAQAPAPAQVTPPASLLKETLMSLTSLL